TFFDYIYEQAKLGAQTFASTLLGHYRRGFQGAPKAPAGYASAMIDKLLGWIDTVCLPEETGQSNWGAWMLGVLQDCPFLDPTEEFRELVLALDELGEGELTLERFLNQIEPLGRDRALAEADGVRVMTMMGSKGLTVSAVVIAGVEEGLVPRPDSPMGEECRILYVAMTRAREFLYCTWARRRRGPTARAGTASSDRRRHSHFFEGGPVNSEDGPSFIRKRLP
ncbi:MAG: 3'-5' exonuclease, partial [Candidatus Eisenbacteria bacterium]